MPDKAWKRMERATARFLGRQRTPLSGGNSKHTRADIIDDELYVECKYSKRFAVLTLMKTVRVQARRERKLPIVVLQESRARDRYYIVPERYLVRLAKILLGRQDGSPRQKRNNPDRTVGI